MKRARALAAALGAAFPVAIAPGVAGAAPGYMICQGYQSDNARVIASRAFPADSGAADAAFDQFLLYLKDGYVRDFSKFQGICDWNGSQSTVETKAENFKRHFEQQGARRLTVDFTAKPAG